MVGIVLDGGGEQGVDEGGLAEARLASNLDCAVRITGSNTAEAQNAYSKLASHRDGGVP